MSLRARIAQAAAIPGLHPETLLLLEMAAEADRTGKMPDLTSLQRRRYHTQDRRSPGSMGIQRRITSAKLFGPWVEGASTTQAWKAYKRARKQQDSTPPTRID